MKTKSRTDLLNQVIRMAEHDRQHNGITWYCGVCNMNTRRANRVWQIFGRYQANIVRALGREPEPNTFPFRNAQECYMQFPSSIYAK